jgi:hypothetical protein
MPGVGHGAAQALKRWIGRAGRRRGLIYDCTPHSYDETSPDRRDASPLSGLALMPRGRVLPVYSRFAIGINPDSEYSAVLS